LARGGDRDDYHDRQVRVGKLKLVYHTSRSFKRGWVALGGHLPVGLLLRALGRLVCTGKGHVRGRMGGVGMMAQREVQHEPALVHTFSTSVMKRTLDYSRQR